MLELGEACGDRETILRGHAYRLWQYLELADIDAVDRELAIYERLAEELRMPEHIWHTFAMRGMRALMQGDIGLPSGSPRSRGERASAPSSRSPRSTTAFS